MKQYEQNQNFKVVVSTKNTLIGGDTAKFSVHYADVNDMSNKTEVTGGVTEISETVSTPNTAEVTAAASYGAKMLKIDGTNSTLEQGDVIEYGTGQYAYVRKIAGDKLYLHTPIRAAVASGDTLTQAGNTGNYVTPDIAIDTDGEYIVTVEAPEYGVFVEDRVRVQTPSEPTQDTDAPQDTVAVAY